MIYRVLIADDQPDIRLLMELLFSKDDNFEVVGQADDPETALAMVRELQPDVIILDQSFNAQRTGLEVAPELRRVAPNMKIILFTAFQMAEEAEADPDVDGYVLKTECFDVVPTVSRLLAQSV